jgi:hypothetical protein
MKRYLAFALMIVLLFGTACCAHASEATINVVALAGDVKIISAGETRAVTGQPGMRLKEGSQVLTGAESFAEIALNVTGSNIVKIKENSKVAIRLEGEDKIELIDGEIFMLLRGLQRGEVFRVKTPCATCGARGTGWKTATDGNVTDVAVFEGRVFVRGVKKDGTPMEDKHWIKEGYETKIKKFERPERAARISEDKLEKIQREIKRPVLVQKVPPRKEGKPSAEKELTKDQVKERAPRFEGRATDSRMKQEKMIDRRTRITEDKTEARQESVVEKKDQIREDSVTVDRTERTGGTSDSVGP